MRRWLACALCVVGVALAVSEAAGADELQDLSERDVRALLAQSVGVAQLPALAELLRRDGATPFEDGAGLAARAEALIEAHPDQPLVARTLVYLSWARARGGNPQTGLAYANRALAIATEYGDTKTMALSLFRQAIAHRFLGNGGAAMLAADAAIEKFASLNDQANLAAVHNLAGTIHRRRGENIAALERYSEVIRLFTAVGGTHGLAVAENNTGLIYRDLKRFDLALEHFRAAVRHYETLGRDSGIATTLNNIGIVYLQQEQPRLAMEYFSQALSQTGNDRERALLFLNTGFAYEQLGDTTLALEYFERATAMNQRMSNPGGASKSLALVGRIHQRRGELAIAESKYETALTMATAAEAIRVQSEIQGQLAKLYEEQGRPAAARAAWARYEVLLMQLDDDRARRELATLKREAPDRSQAQRLLAWTSLDAALLLFCAIAAAMMTGVAAQRVVMRGVSR